eukprot:NODE_2142_length_2284_cov_3.461289.p1 GENE.NODE_2142_length_2284_cov_3.461289~~NODE_2142_length_2284_cov_3.461289.p1  ORF type:complete len:202 (-),score=45.40 NODE_2142_length_2284_cov_3.461289:52-657(-)
MATHFPRETFPICHSVQHGFGFVHRLDQMSSGCICTTTTYGGHFLLQWQMCSYVIQREYAVLSHRLVRPGPRGGRVRLCGRILEGIVRARSTFGDRCRLDARGKPAQSHVLPASHLRLEELLGFVVVAIFTGRQHQIRVHLQGWGHPTVYDGRYTLEHILLQGMGSADVQRAPKECPQPRPLPEKHRMELTLRGSYPWQQR